VRLTCASRGTLCDKKHRMLRETTECLNWAHSQVRGGRLGGQQNYSSITRLVSMKETIWGQNPLSHQKDTSLFSLLIKGIHQVLLAE
jgi:hypothetical protein